MTTYFWYEDGIWYYGREDQAFAISATSYRELLDRWSHREAGR